MKISTKGRYALRVMVDLAMYDNGKFISLKDIAQRQAISLKYLESIMRLLISANFVYSARGANGGYRLARKADSYTIKDVLKASEGSLALMNCVEDERYCERCCGCTTISFWKGLNEHIQQYLDAYTIQDIVNENTQFDYII